MQCQANADNEARNAHNGIRSARRTDIVKRIEAIHSRFNWLQEALQTVQMPVCQHWARPRAQWLQPNIFIGLMRIVDSFRQTLHQRIFQSRAAYDLTNFSMWFYLELSKWSISIWCVTGYFFVGFFTGEHPAAMQHNSGGKPFMQQPMWVLPMATAAGGGIHFMAVITTAMSCILQEFWIVLTRIRKNLFNSMLWPTASVSVVRWKRSVAKRTNRGAEWKGNMKQGIFWKYAIASGKRR